MNDLDNLIEQLSDDPQPVKPETNPWKLAGLWLGCAVSYIIIALVLGGARPDLSLAMQNHWYGAELLLLLLLLISTAAGAAALAFPDMYQKPWLVYSPIVIAVLFVLFLLTASIYAPAAPLPVHSYQCCLSIFAFAVLPAIGIFYAMSQLASTHLKQSGAIAALFAFTSGAIWLRLYEQTDSIIHVISWHYLPMVLVMGLGAWLGVKLLRW